MYLCCNNWIRKKSSKTTIPFLSPSSLSLKHWNCWHTVSPASIFRAAAKLFPLLHNEPLEPSTGKCCIPFFSPICQNSLGSMIMLGAVWDVSANLGFSFSPSSGVSRSGASGVCGGSSGESVGPGLQGSPAHLCRALLWHVGVVLLPFSIVRDSIEACGCAHEFFLSFLNNHCFSRFSGRVRIGTPSLSQCNLASIA